MQVMMDGQKSSKYCLMDGQGRTMPNDEPHWVRFYFYTTLITLNTIAYLSLIDRE